jgi:hypothetical protein
MPYAVLAVMTVPAMFYASGSVLAAAIGFAVAVLLAYFGQSLVTVAGISCLTVFLAELLIGFLSK